jgi:VanZ family protein
MTGRQLSIARVLLGIYLVAIAVLCFGKFDSVQEVPKCLWGIPTDKIAHFLMFLPLTVLTYFAFDGYAKKRRTAVLWVAVAFVFGCIFAAGTELVQSRLSYRSGDPADFRADFLAMLVSSLIVLLVILFKHKK